MVGNKYDLEEKRQVFAKDVKNFITENFAEDVMYIEVSAKTGHNIKKLFEYCLYKALLKKFPKK